MAHGSFALFLRGINVGGIKVPMADLRDCLSELGFEDVKTYLQTGNVTFRAMSVDERSIERALTQRFNYEAHVLVFDHAALSGIVDGYPFPPSDGRHRYAILCATADVATELAGLANHIDPTADVSSEGQILYWSCPKGSTLDTPFAKELAKKKWKAVTTNRNINTLEKMV